MNKPGIVVLGVLGVALAMILVIGGAPKTKVGSSKIRTVGLPENGVEIAGPAETAFTELLSGRTSKPSGVEINTLKSSSVFVVNRSGQSIAALRVKWEMLQPDGRSIVRYREFSGGLRVELGGGPAQLSKELPPNESRLVSLSNVRTDSRAGFETNIGGGSSTDDLRDLSESQAITVSVDGVLFVDGTFAGSDTRDFFGSLKAQIEARLEIYEEIVRALNRDSEAMRRVELLAENGRTVTQMSNGTDPYGEGQLEKSQIAGATLAFRKSKGDKWVLDRINAELSKPRINLRKLD